MDFSEWTKKYNQLEDKILSRYPKTKISYLVESKLGKLFLKLINLGGLTLRNTIYIKSRTYDITTLSHEYIHLHQQKSMGLINFLHMYLSPQIHSLMPLLFAILSICFNMPLLFTLLCILISLAFLIPWPSKARRHLEFQGYLMNLAVEYWITKEISKDTRKKVVDSLTSKLYYWMVWSRMEAEMLVDAAIDKLEKNPEFFLSNEAFKDVYEVLSDTTTIRRS